jgi:hypothetical protein
MELRKTYAYNYDIPNADTPSNHSTGNNFYRAYKIFWVTLSTRVIDISKKHTTSSSSAEEC